MKTSLYVNNISISKEEGITLDGVIKLDTFSTRDSFVSHRNLQISTLDLFNFITCASNIYYNQNKKDETYSIDKFKIYDRDNKVYIIGFREASGLYDEIVIDYDKFIHAIKDVLENINVDNVTIPIV